MTSDTICGNTERSDEQEMKTKKDVKECNEFFEVYATNDAILNGLLFWINIQRHVTPENIWKTQAATKFLKEEITDAKEILWRIIGESELGKMKKEARDNKNYIRNQRYMLCTECTVRKGQITNISKYK